MNDKETCIHFSL